MLPSGQSLLAPDNRTSAIQFCPVGTPRIVHILFGGWEGMGWGGGSTGPWTRSTPTPQGGGPAAVSRQRYQPEESVGAEGAGRQSLSIALSLLSTPPPSPPKRLLPKISGGDCVIGGTLARRATFWAHSPPMTSFNSLPALPHPISTPNNSQIEWPFELGIWTHHPQIWGNDMATMIPPQSFVQPSGAIESIGDPFMAGVVLPLGHRVTGDDTVC